MSLLIAMPTTPANLMKNVADNANIFTREFIDGFGFRKQMGTQYGRDIIPLPRIRTTSFLRPGRTGTWNPVANSVNITARQAQLRAIKGDIEFTEVEIEAAWNTYVGEMYMQGSKKSQRDYITETPFETTIVKELLAKAGMDYRMQTAFKGTYNAAGTTAASCDDGLLTKMTAQFGIDIPGVNLLGTATPNATNMVAITQALVALITANNPEYVNRKLQIWMSPQNAQYYKMNCLTAFGINHGMWAQQFDRSVLFDKTNIEIIEEEGMTGSNRIFITVPNNLKFCSDSNSMNVKFFDQIRSWQIALDWKSTLDFCEGQLIWTNTLA